MENLQELAPPTLIPDDSVPDDPVTEFPVVATLRDLEPSRLQQIRFRSRRPGMILFTLGMPSGAHLPRTELTEAAQGILADRDTSLLYGEPCLRLQEHVVDLLARRGVSCRVEEVFLTTGGQQAMDLAARLLLEPGGEVLTEEVVYEGLKTATRLQSPRFATVPTGARGLDVDAVEAYLAEGRRPAFLYLVTDGHNPLGIGQPETTRRRLAELVRQYRLPVLEDDTYGLLHYGASHPPLRAREDRFVLSVGSFSKILAPALRIGWLVAPPELVPKLSALKHGADIDTPSLSQLILAAYLDSGHLDSHLETMREIYRRRRDLLVAALEKVLPEGVRFTHPEGGFYVWLELPTGADAFDLLDIALDEEKVAFVPGQAFDIAGSGCADHALRLSFGNLDDDMIEDGAARLGRSIVKYLDHVSLGGSP